MTDTNKTPKQETTNNDTAKKTGNSDKFVWQASDIQWEDPTAQAAWKKIGKTSPSDKDETKKN